MLRWIPTRVLGFISGALLILNSMVWAFPVYLTGLLRLVPIPAWQKLCSKFMHAIPEYWQDVNEFLQDMIIKTEWDIQGVDGLKQDDWYLLLCNHQSWADILVLERVFNRKIPLLKFFMKKQLLWTLPFAGLACHLLGYPFMERYGKEYLAKHPERKGKDIETTRKACEKFKYIPTALLNFPEGTRFTPDKHVSQQSPYKYLLRPKAGGIAFTLATMGEYFHKVINVTIIYPEGYANAWSFLCGRMQKIIVRVETFPIPSSLLGDYENDRDFRIYFQRWLNDIWYKKDELIAKYRS